MEPTRKGAVQRHLEVYEQEWHEAEQWRKDHDAVEVCWKFEDVLAFGIAIFHRLERRVAHWRRRVSQGAIPYSETTDAELRESIELWLRSCPPAYRAIGFLEQEY